ncbi:hypothetical protein Tco_0321830 [Tanacetum coccineum]
MGCLPRSACLGSLSLTQSLNLIVPLKGRFGDPGYHTQDIPPNSTVRRDHSLKFCPSLVSLNGAYERLEQWNGPDHRDLQFAEKSFNLELKRRTVTYFENAVFDLLRMILLVFLFVNQKIHRL